MSEPPRNDGEPPVGVEAAEPGLGIRARALARELGLACVAPASSAPPYRLTVAADGISLRRTGDLARPVRVDFGSGSIAYRHRHGGGRRQPLGRAAGLRGGERPTILDGTAGLGTDALVLAGLGCRVHMLERSVVVATLLADGLQRAHGDPYLGTRVVGRISLRVGDAVEVLETRSGDVEAEDVVYLDPMYPDTGKTALPGKAMQYFRALLGDAADAPRLLAAALAHARRRVVVKRPRRAPPLDGPAPDHAIRSRHTRYDVYLVRN